MFTHKYWCWEVSCLFLCRILCIWQFFFSGFWESVLYYFSDNFLPFPLGLSEWLNFLDHVSNDFFLRFIFQSLSVSQFSHSVICDSSQPNGLQHSGPPCPSLSPGACSNSCPLIQWCHPTISFSVVPFSSHLQSFPASGSFQISQLFASGGQSIGVSALKLWIFRTDFL